MDQWQILEALGGGDLPMRFRVRLLKAGVSHNRNEYPLHVLREAAPLFNGARVRAVTDEEHLSGRKGGVRDLVAGVSDATADDKGLVGTVTVSEAEKWLAVKMNDALNGIPGFFGFSLVAEARGKVIRSAGKIVRRVSKITKVSFVDAVVDPSAGGEIMGLAEAMTEQEDAMNREKLLKLIESKAPEFFKTLDVDNLSDEELMGKLAEALDETKDPDPDDKPGDDTTILAEAKTAITAALAGFREELDLSVKKRLDADAASRLFADLFTESKLPADARAFVLGTIEEAKLGDATAIAEAITGHRKYLAEAAGYSGPGSAFANVDFLVDGRDKFAAGLDGFFLQEAQAVNGDEKNKIEPIKSIREAYITHTGDVHCTGMTENCINLSEAEIGTASWANLLLDAMHKSMQKEYTRTGMDQHKLVSTEVPVADFRTNYRPQMGGFSNLVTVAASAAYQAFTTEPDDFAADYTVTKYGNLQDITLETIVDDDVGAVQRMPASMARAAMRTVATVFWTLITGNADWTADDVALFHSTHGANTTTSAMSDGTVKAGRLAMNKQTEPQSAEIMGINPKYLIVPLDLQDAAFELCYSSNKPFIEPGTAGSANRENEGIPNVIQSFGLTPLVVPILGTIGPDLNNWFMAADQKDVALAEIGYLGGRNTPEIFIADLPTQGSLFTDDVIQYKIRLIFGIAILDYRGWYGGIVA